MVSLKTGNVAQSATGHKPRRQLIDMGPPDETCYDRI